MHSMVLRSKVLMSRVMGLSAQSRELERMLEIVGCEVDVECGLIVVLALRMEMEE